MILAGFYNELLEGYEKSAILTLGTSNIPEIRTLSEFQRKKVKYLYVKAFGLLNYSTLYQLKKQSSKLSLKDYYSFLIIFL